MGGQSLRQLQYRAARLVVSLISTLNHPRYAAGPFFVTDVLKWFDVAGVLYFYNLHAMAESVMLATSSTAVETLVC